MRSRFAVALLVLSIGASGYAEEENASASATDSTVDSAEGSTSDVTRDPAARKRRSKQRPRIKAPPPPSVSETVEEPPAQDPPPRASVSNTNENRVHPIHSSFFFTNKSDIALGSSIGFGFGESTSKTTNSPSFGQNSFIDRESDQFTVDATASYGLTDKLAFTFGIGYSSSTSSRVGYRDSTGTTFNPNLGPDVKNSGLTDPTIGATYRLGGDQSEDFVLDFAGGFTIGVQDAKRGARFDNNFDLVDESATEGNAAQGGSSLALGVKAGKMFNEMFGASAIAGLGYVFETEYTLIKGGNSNSDLTVNTKAAAAFTVGLQGEWRANPMIIVNPSLSYTIVPTTTSEYVESFNRIRIESDSGSVIRLGADLNFAFNSQFALTGGYNYVMTKNGDAKSFQNDIEQNQVSVDEDDTSHEFELGLRFLF